MRRRITLTMVGVVAAALFVATVGTAVAIWFGARADAQRDLAREARLIAQRLDDIQRPAVLNALAATLRLQDVRIVAQPPPNLDINRGRLRAGQTVSGATGGLVYAVAPAPQGNFVVLTRRVETRLPAALWVVAGATLIVTALVATNLGRRLTRPLREAEEATKRIAAGDLSARVPVQPRDGEELAGLAQSINAMAASLERSRGLERQFLLSVSHDLRTPLTSIRGYAEALADGQAPDPTQAASVILSEARRLERLVQDLLELARLGARHFSLNVRPIDAAEVVGRAADGFRPAAERAGVTLTVHTDGPATVDADGDRLGQIVANLVENALKYAATRIDIRVRPGVEIVIEDDGPGIAPDDAAHVFEPFFRSTRAPTREVGTGLGLAIVRELVEAMGGTVRADGTRMAVAIPGTRAGRGAA